MIEETGGAPVEKENKKICPFLGIKEDPSTVIAFPSIFNLCNLAEPRAAPAIVHQKAFCLVEAHKTCPVFLKKEIGPLPRDMSTPRPKRVWGGKQWKAVWMAVGVLVLAVIAWQVAAGDLITKYFSNSSILATITSTPVEIPWTGTPTLTDTSTRTNTPTLTGTPARTNTPTLTRTATVSPNYAGTATAACAVFRRSFAGTPCP
jgi:hypothetical protein